jgi:DNA/RNA-binding domain of Phe-tRNA-synthetase-like protein
MRLRTEIEKAHFEAAGIVVRGVEVKPSGPAVRARLDELLADLGAGRAGGGEAVRAAVRDLLRNGRYRPSGRAKPAQEYLDRVYRETGRLDLINNAVDVNNIVSLRYGLPISAFDVAKLQGDLVIRLGRAGERYLFNASGQELDCEDLVVVCDDRGPIGSPVKDSQATKLFEGASSVVYVVYASGAVISPEKLLDITADLGRLLVEDCPAATAAAPVPFDRT